MKGKLKEQALGDKLMKWLARDFRVYVKDLGFIRW